MDWWDPALRLSRHTRLISAAGVAEGPQPDRVPCKLPFHYTIQYRLTNSLTLQPRFRRGSTSARISDSHRLALSTWRSCRPSLPSAPRTNIFPKARPHATANADFSAISINHALQSRPSSRVHRLCHRAPAGYPPAALATHRLRRSSTQRVSRHGPDDHWARDISAHLRFLE